MSSIGTTTKAAKTKAAKTKVRPGTVVLWIAQVFLAVEFVSAGIMKLAGNEQMVEMFTEVGAGQWLRYVVGTLELAGALGLLIPRLCGLAALGLTALMAGAVVTSVFVLGVSPVVPLAILLVAGAVAWFRRATIGELAKAVR